MQKRHRGFMSLRGGAIQQGQEAYLIQRLIDEGHEVFDAKHSSLHPLFNKPAQG